jgi:sigma-B regulation protein RsbU (phosphoserine phosphatase)
MRLALAGHPPALVRTADGRVAELGTPGTPVGLVDEPSFSTVQHLLRDETITFYTDGVSEARGTAGMYGETRLLELVRQMAHDPQVITEEIARAALDFQAGVASDDIAIVTFAAETQ